MQTAPIMRELKRLGTDLRGLKTQMHELRSDVSGLKTDVHELRSDVSGLKTDVGGLETNMGGLKNEMREFKSELRRIDLKNDDRFQLIKSEFQSIRSEMTTKNELAELAAKMATKDDIRIIQEQVVHTHETLIDLRSRVKHLENRAY